MSGYFFIFRRPVQNLVSSKKIFRNFTPISQSMHSTPKGQRLGDLIRDVKYQIPKFNSLFKYYANPFDYDKALMNEWMDWMFHFSLLSKDHYERRIREASVMTTSYMYPFCKSIPRFERLVKWMTYLFIFDDTVELGRDTEATRHMLNQTMICIERLEAIYIKGERPHISILGFKPFIICTNSVVEDILIDFNMEQRKRFLNIWRTYCVANNKENELIDKQTLDLDEISKIRLESGAMQTIFALIEYSEEMYIPDQVWHDPRIQRLMDLCNLSTVFVNDVYSFEKEYLEQNEDMSKMIVNIVGFHVLKYKCTVIEAIETVLDVIKEYERQYKELADSLINDDSVSADIKKFVKCLTDVNGGNFALSIHCNRYNNIRGGTE